MERLTTKPRVVEFIEKYNGDKEPPERNFPYFLPDDQVLICLQVQFGESLDAEKHSAICGRCRKLLACLLRIWNIKTEEQQENNFIFSLKICCVVLTLTDYDIPAKRSIGILADHFEAASAIDLFKIVKRLSVHRLCKDLSLHIDEMMVTVIQNLLWKHNSKLWSKLSGNESESKIPSYKIIRDQKQALNCNQDQRCYVSSDGSASKGDEFKAVTPLFVPSFITMFHDVYCYAFERFKTLNDVLSTTDLLQEMWTVFNYIMTNHCREILYDRRLDQIIICTIYAICRARMIPVRRPNLKTITQCYASLPHSDLNVLKVFSETVTKTEFESKNPFLKFYNDTFLPPIKPFIQSNVVEDPSLQHSPIPTHRDSSVCVSNNVYVSPLRKGVTSPQRSMEYKFSSSPSSQLRNINEMLRNSPAAKRSSSSVARKPQPTKIKRISFQSDENTAKVKSTSLLR